MSDEDKKKIIELSNDAWRKLSKWWDDEIEDGDPFHRLLIFPKVLQLVDPRSGKRILDIGCGNGALSRRLADQGASVVGVDVSETFVEQARKRSDEMIRYQVLDATSFAELKNLATAAGSFDCIVCSMVLHDLPSIKPLLQALPSLLKSSGTFVFSIPHPCFNMGRVSLNFFDKVPSVTRSHYVFPEHLEMKSKRDQPINQHCFHRSLSDIFQAFFSEGMLLDALIEPSISDVSEDLRDVDLDWKLLPEIPPALICRWVFKA